MREFVYTGHPGRVLFGPGTVDRLGDEAARLGMNRALILSGGTQKEQARDIAARLGARAAGFHPHAAMHTPVDVTERALAVVRGEGIDGLIAIGGGSAIGLGKALAVRTNLPQIAVPTTYAGSEMTPVLGETEHGVKTVRSDPAIRPQVVIYDVELTLGLPPALSGTSGMNAMAHAVEALYARDGNPVVDLMALEGIRALASALPRIVADPADRAARIDALYGAWLCGACLGAVGMALHHKLCHVLGGSYGLPHAEIHTAVLPHALAYNAPAIPEAMARLRTVLGADPASALYDLAGAIGAQRGLAALGLDEEGVEGTLTHSLANAYWNPRPLQRDALGAMLRRAFAGAPPETEG